MVHVGRHPVAPAEQSTKTARSGAPLAVRRHHRQDSRVSNRRVSGLGGLAVLALVATNLGLPLPGGYLTIDILLVAVGFDLARGVQRQSRETHWLKHFWLGRLAQVGAPLLIALGLVVLYWNWRADLDEPKLRAVLGSVTMTLNFFTIFGDAAFMAIAHLWLIGVIVQFAVVAPFLVNTGRGRFGSEHRASAILGLAAGVALCRFLFLAGGAAAEQSVAINTVTRLDGLLVGLAIAVAPVESIRRRVPVRHAAPAFAALLLLLLLAPTIADQPTLALGFALPLAIGLSGVVIAAQIVGERKDALATTLDNQVLRWLGLRVVSLYIWHRIFGHVLEIEVVGPVAELEAWPGLAVFIVRMTFTLAAAATSYRYLELPAIATARRIADRPTEAELEAAEAGQRADERQAS